MPVHAAAIRSIAWRAAARKCSLSSRSSGGYPVTASSGKTTSCASAARACSMPRRISASLPAMSPTTLLIWASATRTTRKLALRALSQPAVDELLQGGIRGRTGLERRPVGAGDDAGGRRIAAQDDGRPGRTQLRRVRRAQLLGQRGQRLAVGRIGVGELDVAGPEQVAGVDLRGLGGV